MGLSQRWNKHATHFITCVMSLQADHVKHKPDGQQILSSPIEIPTHKKLSGKVHVQGAKVLGNEPSSRNHKDIQ